jgi:hypothetical protein
MQKLLDLVEKHLGTEWLGVTDWLRDTNSLDDIESRIRAGDWSGAVQQIQDAALRFAAETHSQYVRSAETASKWLDDQPATADSLIRFDVTQPAVIQRARDNQLEKVYGFLDDQNQIARQITQRALADGTAASLNPREIAQQFRDAIGLAPIQEQWLANYRRSLESGDYTRALGYELSSGHSDRTIAAAQDAGRTLTQDQIDLAVERFRQNALTYRAETIARTETLRNVHEGVRDSFEQAVSRGDVDADQLVKEWIHAGGEREPRASHLALDGTQVGFRDTFDVGGVRMQFPGDSSAPVSETANCRCTVAHTLKDAA